MIVLGADPGIANLGASVVEVTGAAAPPLLSYCKAFHTDPNKTMQPARDLERRLGLVVAHVVGLAAKYHVQIAGIEDQADVGWAKDLEGKMDHNSRRARDVAFVLTGALLAIGVEVYLIRPQSARVALLGKGAGRASKEDIKLRVEHMSRSIGADIRLSEHACDSVAIGAGAYRLHIEHRARPRMLGGGA
jgi:Holliday junction resolvasome RuvABC endonuclease subunit